MYKRVVITEFGDIEVLKLVEEPNLPEPKEDEVRIKVLTASASFTDVWIRKGTYPHLKERPPFSPGYDCVGIIDAVGSNVTAFDVGQQVAALTVIGSYTEYICLPASELTLVPENVDPVQAVCLILSYMTAYQMLHRIAAVKEGQSILIHGATGAVGSALVQLGKLHSLKIYGTASTSKQHVMEEEMGIFPIDYVKSDFVSIIKNQTVNGVDVAFDAIGWKNFKRSFKSLKPKGKLVPYGFYNSSLGRGGTVVLDYLRVQLLNLNFTGRSVTFYDILSLRKKKPLWFSEDLTKLFALLANGEIQPMVAKTFSLSDAQQVHKQIENAKVNGKLVFVINKNI